MLTHSAHSRSGPKPATLTQDSSAAAPSLPAGDHQSPPPAAQPGQPKTAAAREKLRASREAARAKFCSDEVMSHIPALRIYARSLARDAVLADDLVQDTLLRAIASIAQFRPGSNLRAWLFTILRNRFYNDWAKRRRESTGGQSCVSDQPQSAGDQQVWSLTLKETERALARLPPHYAEALITVTVLGTSYIDAARIMNCDVGTVKSRINRGRARLREEMGDLFC